jgi:hypothetical protein
VIGGARRHGFFARHAVIFRLLRGSKGHGRGMTETRKLAAILASDVLGHSRLAADGEQRTVARLRALRSDLADPVIVVARSKSCSLLRAG